MKVLILGPPGSGKGTISEQLEKEFHFFHVSAGELLRKEAAKNTAEAKKIKTMIDAGHLVPNELVVKLIKKDVKNKRKYILDGFPRNVEQAEAIEDLKVDVAINLDVPEEIIIERLSGRRVCTQGHHGYHLKYLPPKKAGICNYDGSALIQRKDDTPEVIRERFKIFRQETEPVVGYYQRKKILKQVDGSGSPDLVYERVKEVLGLK